MGFFAAFVDNCLLLDRLYFVRSLALAVDDLSTILLILFLGDPVRSEGGQGAEGGTTGPDGVVSVSWSHNVNDTLLWAELVQLFLESIGKTLVESSTTGADDVLVQVSSHIKIALTDGSESQLVETLGLITLLDQVWLEDTLWGLEARSVHVDSLTVGELERFLVSVGATSLAASSFVVLSYEAALLLNGSNDLEPGTLTTLLSNAILGQELDEEISDNTSSDKVLQHGVRNREAFVNWDGVGNTITGIADETSGSTVGVERQDGLNSDVKAVDIEGLEHELSHFFSVGLWVAWSLSEEDIVLRWVNSKLVVEAVLPDLLHIVPRLDDTRLNWVVELQDTSHLLSLIANILGLGVHTNKLLVSSWNTDNSWEFTGWLILSGKTGFENTGTVVNNNVLGHLCVCIVF